jgi:HK97 family phage portal protein
VANQLATREKSSGVQGLFWKAVTTIASGLGYTSPQLYQLYRDTDTYSGRNVGVDSALQLDTVWACVRLVSQTISTLPLEVYKRGSNKGGDNNNTQSVVAPEHPLYRILHDRPNSEMTAVEFWQAMVACLLLWGNAYAQIIRGTGGRVVALIPMRPDFTQVRREADGSLIFIYNFNGISIVLSEDDVFHLKGFSLDGYMGLSAVAAGRHSLGSAMSAEEASGAIFRNGMRISGFVKAPIYLDDAHRSKAQGIIDRFKGAHNTGGVPLLEGGWDYQQLSIPPEDAQLLETRSFHVEQICRWFDVPPIMIGHMEKTTAWGSGLEQMNLWFLTYALRAKLKSIEQAIAKSLLSPQDQVSYFAEFNVEALLRADSRARSELYASLVSHGLRTPNELRALDNLPPKEGGDELVMQSNMLPTRLLGQVATMPKDKPVAPGEAVASKKPEF